MFCHLAHCLAMRMKACSSPSSEWSLRHLHIHLVVMVMEMVYFHSIAGCSNFHLMWHMQMLKPMSSHSLQMVMVLEMELELVLIHNIVDGSNFHLSFHMMMVRPMSNHIGTLRRRTLCSVSSCVDVVTSWLLLQRTTEERQVRQ